MGDLGEVFSSGDPTEALEETDSERNAREAVAIGATIVATAGTAVVSKVPGLGPKLEAAMVAAVEACHAAGITDPVEILAAKMAAKDAFFGVVEAQGGPEAEALGEAEIQGVDLPAEPESVA